jgi:hypothetical protein
MPAEIAACDIAFLFVGLIDEKWAALTARPFFAQE